MVRKASGLPVIHEQLAKAAVRLAGVLNRVLWARNDGGQDDPSNVQWLPKAQHQEKTAQDFRLWRCAGDARKRARQSRG
jgi:hypothetical protein